MKINTILADRYQILEQLNYKTSRQTFLARNLQSQDLVIVKILRFDNDFKWDDHKLFEREASTLQNLHHPAIPEYLDYFDLDEPTCRGFALVQTYIDAPSLESVIKVGRKFSEKEVIELADRILTVLAYLHEQLPAVIHRDIKPSNILLGDRSGNSVGDIYLVDFGSVQTAASTDGGTITIVGTCGYMPLEQFSGQTTTASDLYSLGMTIIYLLTGNHPSELATVNGQVKFTAEVSNRFRRWLEKMTQPYLEKRFDSAILAQIALTSEDGSYGDFVHLKPANTKVQLYRDREKLEIVWNDIDRERTGLINNIFQIPVYLIGYMLINVFLLSLFSWIITVIVGSSSFWSAVLGLLFIGSFCCASFSAIGLFPVTLVITSIIKQFKGNVDYKLVVNTSHIFYGKSQAKKQKTKILSQHLRSQIELLVYSPSYVFDKYSSSDGITVHGPNISALPKLYLYCADVEYHWPSRLSQAELWWLGNELSDFLNLELQIIYPTPQLPPVTSCGGGC
jgi:serine/threonine protein kinase